MLNCKEAAELASESIDHKLSWRKRMALKLHLRVCECVVCGGFKRQINAFRDAMVCYRRSLIEGRCTDCEKMPDDCKQRLKEKLSQPPS